MQKCIELHNKTAHRALNRINNLKAKVALLSFKVERLSCKVKNKFIENSNRVIAFEIWKDSFLIEEKEFSIVLDSLHWNNVMHLLIRIEEMQTK